MIYFDKNALNNLEKTYRTKLLNSVYGFRPVNLIGTINSNSQENLAIFSSLVHLGANPSLMAYIQRPVTEHSSHTYKNIIESGYFTINQVNKQIYKNAHFTSARFTREESEFEFCKLTPEYKSNFIAPFVKESHVQIGLKFVQEIAIELNNTKLIIGEVEHLFINEESVLEDGTINPEENQAISVNGLDAYFESNLIEKLPYAKIEQLSKFL
jgi:flavin reductase (DIM6/NTAB) family NADH-FMN oxidoreductase RutF